MSDRKEIKEALKELREKYKYKAPEAFDQDELERKIKYIVTYKLNKVDSTILLLYSEAGSLRQLSEMLNCSAATARKEIKNIRGKVFKELEKLKERDDL